MCLWLNSKLPEGRNAVLFIILSLELSTGPGFKCSVTLLNESTLKKQTWDRIRPWQVTLWAKELELLGVWSEECGEWATAGLGPQENLAAHLHPCSGHQVPMLHAFLHFQDIPGSLQTS